MYLHRYVLTCIYVYIYTYLYKYAYLHKRIGILLDSSQNMVHLRTGHCCYHSRVVRVEIYVETVTSFTDLLIEDVSRKKKVNYSLFPF